jgi:hypothetical protein
MIATSATRDISYLQAEQQAVCLSALGSTVRLGRPVPGGMPDGMHLGHPPCHSGCNPSFQGLVAA